MMKAWTVCLASLFLLNTARSVPLATQRRDVGARQLGGSGETALSDPSFDRDLAESFVNFSRICYCDDDSVKAWSCSTCQAMAPFEIAYHSNETYQHVGVFVGYWPKRNMVLVVFRGSQYLINFIQDLASYAVDADYPQCESADPLPPGWEKASGRRSNRTSDVEEDELEEEAAANKCKVHSGFFDDWKTVRDDVLGTTKQVMDAHPGAQVWVTGHSMGGAMAIFCALDIRIRLQASFVGVYTFGQPRVGNEPFAAFISATIPNAIRIVHQSDVVPHLPPMTGAYVPLTNFHHNPTEVWQTGTEDDEFRICDATGEDSKCSNSLPSWEHSVEAHMFYVGWPMHCEKAT